MLGYELTLIIFPAVFSHPISHSLINSFPPLATMLANQRASSIRSPNAITVPALDLISSPTSLFVLPAINASLLLIRVLS
jgi:hypothetical protein